MNFENITLNEYFALSDIDRAEYRCIFQTYEFKKPIDCIGIGDLYEKTFGLIKQTQTDGINYDFADILKALVSFSGRDVEYLTNDIGVLEFLRSYEYLITELEKLAANEIELLSEQPDPKMLASGIEDFNQFGVYNQFRKLTGGDITKIKDVEAMDYSTCLTELYYQKVQNDFNKRYSENVRT